jgi:hypothetical protein
MRVQIDNAHVTPTPTRSATRAASSGVSLPQTNDIDSQQSSSTGTLTPDTQDSELFKMADAANALDRGSLLQATLGTLQIEQPTLQCLQVRPMSAQSGQERWRVVMSDGINFMQGMLGSRMPQDLLPRHPKGY